MGGALIIALELDVRSLWRTVVRVTAVGFALTMLLVLLAAPITDRFSRGADPTALRMLAPIVFLIALWIVPNALLRKAPCFKRIATAVVIASISGLRSHTRCYPLGAHSPSCPFSLLLSPGWLQWTFFRAIVRTAPLLCGRVPMCRWVGCAGFRARLEHITTGPFAECGALITTVVVKR